MISSYPPAIRRHLLSKHFLISTMPEEALDDLVKFTTVARFEPHRVIFSKGDKGDCLYGILPGRVRIYSNSADGASSRERSTSNSPSGALPGPSIPVAAPL
jgi:CRP-like cAMP-binding protein